MRPQNHSYLHHPDLCDDRGVVRSRVRSSFIHLPMLHVGSPAFRFHEVSRLFNWRVIGADTWLQAVRNTQDIVHVYDQSGDLDVTYSDWHAFRLPLWTILSVLVSTSCTPIVAAHRDVLGCHFICARANSTRIRYVSLRCMCDPNILTMFLQWRCEHSDSTYIDPSPDVLLGLIHGREVPSSHKRHRGRRTVCRLLI
jgi:hypothetical protein